MIRPKVYLVYRLFRFFFTAIQSERFGGCWLLDIEGPQEESCESLEQRVLNTSALQIVLPWTYQKSCCCCCSPCAAKSGATHQSLMMGSRIVSGQIIPATKRYPMDKAARALATFIELYEWHLKDNRQSSLL